MKSSIVGCGCSLYAFWLVISSTRDGVGAKFYSASVARQSLITDLFVNYDPAAKPAPKGERIDLHANLALQHFAFRESDGAFHFVGLLDLTWRDPKLGWNPIDYNNLTRIPVRQKLIWVPDLEVYNNAPDKFLRMHYRGVVILEYTGVVLWSDNIEISTFCTTQMSNWPHDRHECKLSLGSWTYDGFELDFMNYTNPNETVDFKEIDMSNMEYRVLEFRAERVATVYPCCAEPYITMDYHLTFERRCAFAIVFRTVALTVIILSLLALSIEAGQCIKICINGLNLIIITFTLIHFSHNVGKFTRSTPLIVKFFSYSFVLVTFEQMLSVFSIFAAYSSYRGKLPHKVSSLLRNSFVSHLTPKQKTPNAQRDDTELNSQFEDVTLQELSNLISADSTAHEWMQLAAALERFTFILFGVIYFILATIWFI